METRSCQASLPAKCHKINMVVNRRSCLLFHCIFLSISWTALNWGKIQEVLLVPFSIYRVWRSEYALFLALYDSDYWDVLKVLSERTLQNMTKLTWEIKRVKSAFLGDKKPFSNFLGFICFYICLSIISSYWNQNTCLKERTQTFEMGIDFHRLERSVILKHRLVMSEMKI